jgi:energy-coupling factor transporter ATP-binding protein EcfA2
MPYEPITTLEIENYGCIKKAKFELSPLHALIGPNDSGKSTTLRALRTVAQFAAGDFGAESNSNPQPFEPMLRPRPRDLLIRIGYSDGLAYGVRTDESATYIRESVFRDGKSVASDENGRAWNLPGIVRGGASIPVDADAVSSLNARVSTATLVRFEPDSLRAPGPLIPEREGIRFSDERGAGLPGVFDAIINRDADAFVQIQGNLRRLFPHVAKLGLVNASNSTKEVAVTLTDGNRVSAESMSEGLLYYLGFEALKYISDCRLFLVEEPENGLHPARIAEVMATLRELSKSSQVVIATHSPLVVNELSGDEVTVVTRKPDVGTMGTLLKNVPRYEESSKVYQPGELWLSYADGNLEEPLLTGSPRT